MTSVELRSPEGFKVMYRTHLTYVHSVLQRLGARPPHVEDLVHDVFMTAFRKREDFDATRPLKPWLFGLAYRLLLNAKRKNDARGDDTALPGVVDGKANPEEETAEKEGRTALSRAIATLSADRRAVFLMHDIEGHAAPDIARELEIPLNTAYSRLRLARADILKQTEALRSGGVA